MHSFDFISQSPQVYIFQKSANKTNLGGIFFLIYIIIVIIISLLYLFDYISNDKYTVEYSSMFDELAEDEVEKMNEDETLNPTLLFKFQLYDYFKEKELSKNFIIRSLNNPTKNLRGKYYLKTRVNDLNVGIFYYCENGTENCDLKEEEKTNFNFNFQMEYSGFKIYHQNESEPLQKITDIFFRDEYPFFFKYPIIRTFNWENIIYKEDAKPKSIFDYFRIHKKEVNYTAGHFVSSEVSLIDDSLYNPNYGQYKLLGIIRVKNLHFKHIEYKRKKVGILNIIANVFALSTTIRNSFKLVFSFVYSKNFDNYKIIDNIISNKMKANKNDKAIKFKKEIELSDDFKKNKTLLDKNENNENLLSINESNNETENEIINNDLNNGNCNNESTITIPKLNFWDFLLNNIYCNNKCGKSRKQELISTSNQILKQYFSIEHILFNQIKFENLLKDYKWNEKNLNNLDENELIKKLINNI